MRRILYLILAISLLGCQDIRHEVKHIKSSLVGLKRRVILYDNSGNTIKEWRGRFKVETDGGLCRFVTDDGKAVYISGTFIIEEE